MLTVLNMIDHHNEPDNSNRELDRPAHAERSESPANADGSSTGSYYYDDSTGYEVYDDDDEDEREEK
jgi:hypothetical protein